MNGLEIWQFVTDQLRKGGPVMMLVVAESSGSSPGRAGYKMAVTSNGELCGSIGGGVMEVALVEQAKAALSQPGATATGSSAARILEQVHQKISPHSSGMICSGRQTVIMRQLTADDLATVDAVVDAIDSKDDALLILTEKCFVLEPAKAGTPSFAFKRHSDTEFEYNEPLGSRHRLYIIGGGHCALALSEVMSRMDFHISIYDDRPELNTLEKNHFANKITILDNYETIGDLLSAGADDYVVVMTLGYRSDEKVIKALFEHDLKYFGVLGSKAKMKVLLTTLEREGYSKEKLSRIHTPIGLPINSRTPEEIAISIAAEIIAIKNS